MRGRRVAAAIITGDSWDKDEVKRLLESLEPHIDKVFVSYNGTKPTYPAWSKLTTLPIGWARTEWVDDFAVARNHSFSLVPPDDFDWILWIDTDDVFVAPDGLDPVFDSLDEYTVGVFMRYAYAVDQESGEVVVEQWRERLMATDWTWQWKWPVHECAIGPPGTQFAKRAEAWIEHQRTSGEDRGARVRNRRIIDAAIRREPNEPRYLFYQANEMMAEASGKAPGYERNVICDGAVSAYRGFLESMMGQETDDVYNSAVRIGDLHALKFDWNAAVDGYMQAVKFRPSWPDAYIGIAKAFMETGDFPRMREFADIACMMDKPITAAAVEPMNSSFNPLFLRGIGREETGDLEGAIEDYEEALKVWRPANGSIEEKIGALKQRLLDKGERAPDDTRKRLRGTRREKSIAFYTNPIPEVWNYDTLAETGHGGSETMVLQMAEMFAQDGWRAAIFGMPGDDARGLQDNGVELYNFDEWLPNEPFSAFVSSRAGDPFTAPINAKAKLLWLHDVNTGPDFRRIQDKPDAILALTQWHGRHLSKLYSLDPSRIAVIPNGIELEKFPVRTSWDEAPRFIWSSSPDRGLETLLGLWPHIRGIAPDATLDVYYGWQFIDKLIASGTRPWLQHMKDRIMGGVDAMGGEAGGIYWRDRVPPDTLAKAFYDAEFWAYPTSFMETFCISAVMAQAAGVIPICSDLAGLTETVKCPWFKLEGWPLNTDYQSRLLAKIRTALGGGSAEQRMRDKARAIGREHAEKFSLDRSYAAWQDLLTVMGARTPVTQVLMPDGSEVTSGVAS